MRGHDFQQVSWLHFDCMSLVNEPKSTVRQPCQYDFCDSATSSSPRGQPPPPTVSTPLPTFQVTFVIRRHSSGLPSKLGVFTILVSVVGVIFVGVAAP